MLALPTTAQRPIHESSQSDLLAVASVDGRTRDSFDFGWRFQLGDVPGAEQPAFSDGNWRELDLPHDWSIEGAYDQQAPTGGSGGYLPAGIGWYRKSFTLPETARGRQVLIQFDGVYQHSTVWINGHELGTRPYGYATFHYDLTPHLRFGSAANVIAVRVDNSVQPNSRWYSGSGIYRHTWLTVSDPLAVAPFGVFVTTPDVSPDSAVVRVQTHVRNARPATARVVLHTEILDERGQPLEPRVSGTAASLEMAAGGDAHIESSLDVPTPQLWSPETPTLYRVRTELRVDDAVVDAVETAFGIRRLEYDVDRGLLINGTPVKLRGMCLHHDGGAVGAAVPEAVLERRLRLLQEMGCNAVRTGHMPMAPEFYDLCDRLGLLVMNEAFDEWTIGKGRLAGSYSTVFNDWYERDVVDFVRRDRNHPSVVMWSAGNEVPEQRAPNGPEVLRKLIELFHREDPTRPVTVGMDNIFNGAGRAPEAFTELLDVVGYNYVDRWGTRRETHYADDRHHFPQRKFVGTESTSASGLRGEYRFGPLLGGGFIRGQIVPGVGPEGALYTTTTIRTASLWRFAATHDYVIGDFGWTGFDYLGEARWPRKGAASGPLDTCGFKKDTFYFYQSIWTSAPVLHLLPHWNWPERVGQVVPVVAYSNCAAIELFLNGRSLGVKAREFPAQGAAGGWNSYTNPVIRATTADFQLVWDVPYEPGELKALAYDRHGAVIAEKTVRTAGEPATLEVTVDRPMIAADARDVAHVTVRALDAEGVFVPLANNQLTFEVSGPAKLIGVDNGDLTNHESYKLDTRALHHGMALALVQSTREPGQTRLTVRSPGLPDAVVAIEARIE
ncbi:MAG TPA: glycoside hydrolase family 2 TIM barrel-domain containing protein [Candidatus Synoicihabitans sp.]|nr:glycoside hydrolase family 2 TIM barrel-domain containing protein [Candidatus Synoicihabitans sp.]